MHKSRVKVTLNDDATQAIRRLSLASGESMSGIISSLFDPNISELNRMSDLLESAAKIREDLPESSRQFFRSIMADIEQKSKPVNETPEAPEIDPERQRLIDEMLATIEQHKLEKQAMPTHTDQPSDQAFACSSAGRLSDLELAELEESTVDLGYSEYE